MSEDAQPDKNNDEINENKNTINFEASQQSNNNQIMEQHINYAQDPSVLQFLDANNESHVLLEMGNNLENFENNNNNPQSTINPIHPVYEVKPNINDIQNVFNEHQNEVNIPAYRMCVPI